MQAGGDTPMGAAMELAAALLEDEKQVPRAAFRPTVVLVSDGQPTDAWEAGLDRLTRQGRAQKADRMALAIGADASEAMLARFIGNSEKPVFKAEDARMIRSFFRFLSQTQTARSRHTNPNLVPKVSDPFVFKNH